MAFVATDATGESRAMSLGPLKAQLLTWAAISGDTSGTVTADKLYLAQHIIIDGGLVMSAAPTFSGNVVTLAFNDPTATVKGDIIVLGK
jgi:hypothetical protein